MSRTTVVITTIFPPGEAVRAFAGKDEVNLIVVGDRKSAPDWACPGAQYLSLTDQLRSPFALASVLPVDHYTRKMVGYLHAIAGGADVIIDTDDDNMPKPGWKFPPFAGEFDTTPANLGWVNIYSAFTAHSIWPRGFPLDEIQRKQVQLDRKRFSRAHANVGVWQGLADGDPDVDAIYRMVSGAYVQFDHASDFVLSPGTYTPFNSQNTAFCREAFPLLYLPACVSFRYTDILRSYVAQPVLWAMDLHVGVTEATVVQERNAHILLKDFESEVPFYLGVHRVRQVAERLASRTATPGENLERIYRGLVNEGLVPPGELAILQAWLDDLKPLVS
jgi:hypothetical protein